MTDVVTPPRDYVAEAKAAAFYWVKDAARMIKNGPSVPLERWERKNPRPQQELSKTDSHLNILREWREERRNLQLAMHDAVTYAFWAVLKRAGYPRDCFGLPPLPELDVPDHLQSQWYQSGHHLRYCTSRRFSGMLQSVKHKLRAYLRDKEHSIIAVTEDSATPQGNCGLTVRHVETLTLDATAAAAHDLFDRAIIAGLMEGFVEFGVLTANHEQPEPPADPEVHDQDEPDAVPCSPTTLISEARLLPTRVTLPDGSLLLLHPGASVVLPDRTKIEVPHA